MTRYEPHSRRELHALLWTWLTTNRVRFSVLAAGAVALLAFETWMLLVLNLSPEVRWYLIGFLHAAVVATFVGAVGVIFLVHERRAVHQMRGAWGEDFTRDELERARRKKLIWGWVDSVTVQHGDIDHLVVTRAGGVVAVDSKWRSSPTDLDPAAMADDAKRANLRAEAVVHSLLRVERGSHRASARSVRVTPLVVVWGGAQEGVPDSARVNGVDFVPGRRLLEWLGRSVGEMVDEESAADLLSRLTTFRSTAWSSATRRERQARTSK